MSTRHIAARMVRPLFTNSTKIIPRIHPKLNFQTPKRTFSASPKYTLHYTCTPCSARNTAEFSKIAYHKGLVIVTCKNCETRHIIKDNIEWFKDDADKIRKTTEATVVKKIQELKFRDKTTGKVFTITDEVDDAGSHTNSHKILDDSLQSGNSVELHKTNRNSKLNDNTITSSRLTANGIELPDKATSRDASPHNDVSNSSVTSSS